ncbi:GxxExxY protein [uncultured Erythrobacter sp.]|uniref:GxxExxY protein n=1 Tax=uncultured Erythrobacter sp. TaxID=263913 RepID=UPI002658A4CB|nr:GxxExxY protein [uncultured Erythrobacter sp.]
MSRDDDLEALVTVVIDMGLRLHQDLGPGLLESAYEMILFEKLRQRGIAVARQPPLGLLMNFGQPLFKDGIKRITNGYDAGPRP